MTKSGLKYGCQTFTWEMLGTDWTGDADDLVSAISRAGYQGIEITDTMIGAYADRPQAFAARLQDAGLQLVALAYGSQGGFTEPASATLDLEACKKWVDFAAHFPGALVSMGSATVVSPGARDDKFGTAADIYNRSSETGQGAGVTVALHPSSHHNTLLFSRDDYDAMFARLEPAVGWVPDTGHILRAKQDLEDVLATYVDRICYVHLKDVDAAGDWAMLCTGICDIPAVIAACKPGPRFNGWIVVEEESKIAGSNPEAAVRANFDKIMALGPT